MDSAGNIKNTLRATPWAPELPPGRMLVPRKKKEKKSPRFHKGEVVLGKVLEITGSEYAKVRLPAGAYTAQIHEGLRKGDELYFEVIENKPSLVLRVHSVNSMLYGNYRKSREIARMLDIGFGELPEKTAEVISRRKSVVTRKQCLSLIRAYNSLAVNEPDTGLVIRTLFWMDEAGLEPTVQNYDKLKFAFIDLRNLGRYFRQLLNLAKDLNNEGDKLKIFARGLLEGNINLSFQVKFFSALQEHEGSSFAGISNKFTSYPGDIRRRVSVFRNFIDSIAAWNEIAAKSEVPYMIAIPFAPEGTPVITKILIRNSRKNFAQNRDSSIREIYKMILASEIIRKSENINKVITSENVEETLRGLALETRTQIISSGYALCGVLIPDESEDLDILPEQPLAGTRNVTVVI